MKRLILPALLAASPALAQQQLQPPFVPYIITEQQHQQLTTYLGEVPAKWAVPLLNTIAQWEKEAQDAVTKSQKKE